MEKSKKNTISVIECGVQHPFAGRNIQQLPLQSVNIVKYENNYKKLPAFVTLVSVMSNTLRVEHSGCKT